jgi:hypothetical protein
MNRFSNRGFTSNEPLTIEQIAQYAPSALAVAPHESRSSRYTYIPTINIIQGMIKSGFQPFKATQSLSRIEGKQEFTKHMIRFRRADLSFNVGETVPEIVLVNAHDGSSAYKLMGGLFRKVCSNGMGVAESTIGSVSVPHKGDIEGQVIEGSWRIVADSERALEGVRQWSQLQLTSGERDAFAQSAHILRFADSEGHVATPIQPVQLLAPRRYADNASDLWSVFNRVQENVIRGGLTARAPSRYENGEFVPARRVSTREVKGIDQDVRLNRALWQLAEKMAELKGSAAA